MKPIISELVTRYESGRLSRRDLIQGLTALVAAGGASTAGAAQDNTLTATGVDHICVRVSDLQRSAEFYQSLFKLSPLGEDKPHRILRMGNKRVMVSLRQDAPHAQIDHFALSIENFNKDEATRVLKQRGLTPQEDWEYGFYVRDPDGAVVQML
jgi:catechol 2,3-dioxygenase-like lactoylglutathione lyase family enzyme